LNDKDYATLDSDVEDDKTEGQDNVDMVIQPVISTPPETPDLSSASRPSTTKVEKAVVVPSVPADVDESDEDNGTEANSFVVAGDVDVDESWMNHSSSDDDDNDGDVEDQPTPVVIADDIVPDSPTTPIENGTTKPQDNSINFNVDDLEMFMTDQMSKTLPTPVQEKEPSTKSTDSEKPKKKKKKKTSVTADMTPSDPVTTTEKKKKKKTKVKVEENGEGGGEPTPTKSKTKKSKKVKNELDAFFAS